MSKTMGTEKLPDVRTRSKLTDALTFVTLTLLGSAVLMFLISFHPRNQFRTSILLPPAPVDLGPSQQGDNRSFVFQIKNTTLKAITVVKLQTSCGCTWMDDVKGKRVKPGEVLTIKGSMDTANKRGQAESHALLSYTMEKSPLEGNLLLTVRTYVDPLVRITPEPVTFDIGSGPGGSSKIVALDSLRLDEFTLEDASTTESGLVVAVVQPEFRKGDGEPRPAQMQVALDPAMLAQGAYPSSSASLRVRVVIPDKPPQIFDIPVVIREP